jgi:hypothetical protein
MFAGLQVLTEVITAASASMELALAPARVIVDPNSVVRQDPSLTAARFADADRVPRIGEVVIARQPDEDGSDFIGSARVVDINRTYKLIYLRVDWHSFREAASPTGYRPAGVGSVVWDTLRPGEASSPSWQTDGLQLAASS